MVLGKRGLENVHLVEAAGALGGSLNWLTKLPGRQEWRHLIEYRGLQLGKLRDVTTIFNTRLSADDVLDYGAEIVVVAAGSHYSADAVSPYGRSSLPLAGSWAAKTLTPEQVVRDEAPVGHRVLVVDSDGYFVGPGVAELLATRGHEVTAVTAAAIFGQYLSYTMELPRMSLDLRTRGVRVYTGSSVAKSTEASIAIQTPHGVLDEQFDTVVVVGQRVAESDLYDELRRRRDEWESNGIRAVHRIGDCVRPGFIADAVFSGHRLAREIDEPDPGQPLPFIRERRLIGGSDADFTLPAVQRGRG